MFKQKSGLQEPLSADEVPSTLSSPEEVMQKYQHKLLRQGKIGELSVKLAKEAYFGEDIMRRCTVMGQRERPGLPPQILSELKKFLFGLDKFRDCWTDPALFEGHWAKCVDSINHACKSLRERQHIN